MKKNRTTSQKNILIIISCIFILFVFIILIVVFFSKKDLSLVEIRVAPESATTMINGKIYKNGEYNLPVGELNINIYKEGFNTFSKIISHQKGQKTNIYVILEQEDGKYTWYENHDEDAGLVTQIGDYLADQKAKEYEKLYPIIKILPIIYAKYDEKYNYTEFRIDGGNFEDCKKDFCLKITDVTGDNLDLAKQKIHESGFDPDNFEILYQYDPIIPLN